MLIKHSVKLFEIMEHRLRKLRIDHFSSINSTDPYLIKSNSFSSVYYMIARGGGGGRGVGALWKTQLCLYRSMSAVVIGWGKTRGL